VTALADYRMVTLRGPRRRREDRAGPPELSYGSGLRRSKRSTNLSDSEAFQASIDNTSHKQISTQSQCYER